MLRMSILSQIKQKGFDILSRNQKIPAVLVLVGANILNNLIVFIINIIVARKCGPDSFGIFSLATSFMVAVNLVVDLGINLTIVRYYNLYSTDKIRQDTLLLSLLLWKISTVITLVLLSVPLGLIASKIFGTGGTFTLLFSLSVTSAGIFGLWLYFHSYMQAHQQFKKLALFIALGAFLRLVCFLIYFIIVTNSIDLAVTFASVYLIPLIIALGIGLIPIAMKLFRGGLPALSLVKKNLFEILNYGKWVALSGLCHSFIYRGVQFVLATRTSKFELGIFSAGFVFTLAFTPFNTAVRTVFFPHVTAYKSKNHMLQHISRMKKIFPYYILFVIVGIFCLAAIQIIFLGDQYRAALPVFLITSFALTITIFFGLASMLVHTLLRPEIDAYVNVARLLISVILTSFLAPALGSIGGALSYSMPLVLGEVLMVIYVVRLIDESP